MNPETQEKKELWQIQENFDKASYHIQQFHNELAQLKELAPELRLELELLETLTTQINILGRMLRDKYHEQEQEWLRGEQNEL